MAYIFVCLSLEYFSNLLKFILLKNNIVNVEYYLFSEIAYLS